MTVPWVFLGPKRLRLDSQTLGHPTPEIDLVPPAQHEPLPRIDTAVAEALARPLASPPLGELARGARRVVIAIPDASRSCPTALFLPSLLDELRGAGVATNGVQVMVACGLHAATTAQQKAALVGRRTSAEVKVVDAQGLAQPNAFLGQTRQSVPAFMNLTLAAADLVIAVGTVEPHLYAGFSGGAKTVGIGCAGAQTIAWTHSPVFLERPGVELGCLVGNPFQEAVRAIAAKTKLRFALDAVVDEDGRVVALAAGEPVVVQERLAGGRRDAWFRTVAQRYDVILAGIPAPKSESFYQASRAATYLALTDSPALDDDGLILLAADLPTGAGDGPGERNFAELMEKAEGPDRLIARALSGEPLGPGGQRAYMMAKAMRRYRVGVVGAREPAAIGAMGVATYDSVARALADETRRRGRAARVLAVADAITTIVRSDAPV